MGWTLLYSLLPLLLPSLATAADPSCSPGGNFNLAKWNLQMPIGNSGSPTIISPGQLSGCNGYSHPSYFYTHSTDGSLVMKVPGSPENSYCVTTPNSKHCRTELREISPSVSWDPWGPVNRLSATLVVVSTGGSTVVGQVKIDDSISTKPVAELYYDDNGHITLGMAQTRAGGDQIRYPVGDIPVGQAWSYEIRYERNVFSVIINNGAPYVITTYQLNAPLSYFKVGNYLQGSNPSEVHFYAIDVTHSASTGDGSGGVIVAPTWPPAGATESPRSGIGPFNIIAAVDRTMTVGSPPTNTPEDCSPAQPENSSLSTITLKLFRDGNCCSPFQTTKLGTLDSCHNANSNTQFGSFKQAVGQSMFGRNINVFVYDGLDCTGEVAVYRLTNADQCWDGSYTRGGKWRSYRISATASTGGATTPECETNNFQPINDGDSTVTLNLFENSCCETASQTFKLGTLGSCKKSSRPFRDFSQAVGQNMFGRDIKIITYPDDNCQSANSLTTSLSNKAVCYGTNGAHGWNSFQIVSPAEEDGDGDGGSGSNPVTCDDFSQPDNGDSDNTVSVRLYTGSASENCCKAVQTFKVGTLDKCHDAGATSAPNGFTSFAQTVGQNMFGRNIRILAYTGTGCSGSAAYSASLTNSPLCFGSASSSSPYRSFKIAVVGDSGSGGDGDGSDGGSGGGGGGGGGNSCPPPATGYETDKSLTLNLYENYGCTNCNFAEISSSYDILREGTTACIRPHGRANPFTAFMLRVGQDLFGHGVKIRLYPDANCASGNYNEQKLTNAASCYVSMASGWRSYKAIWPSGRTLPDAPGGDGPAKIPILIGDVGGATTGWERGGSGAQTTSACENPFGLKGQNPCGRRFCAGGICGFTWEGCGLPSTWINLNGRFYSNCRWTGQSGLAGICGAGGFFGGGMHYLYSYYECVP